MSFRESFTAGIALFIATLAVALPGSAQASGPMDAPAITIEPLTGMPFGDSEVNSYSLSQRVAIRSSGVTDLAITRIYFAGPDASDFALDEPTPCPAIMVAATSCTFPVYFAPKTLGPKTAMLQMESNSVGGTVSIPLSGNGTPEIVDSEPAPDVFFKKKPTATIRIRAAKLKALTVRFGSDQPGATFQCSVSGKPFSECRSPAVLKNLKPGKYNLKVKASIDGRTGRAATARFKVVRSKK